MNMFFFFFQAEDGIRDGTVTGVQTCALPIFGPGDRTWSDPEHPPALGFYPRRALRADTFMDGGVADDTALADLLPPGLELRLDQRDDLRIGPRSEERRVGKEWRLRW